MKKSIIFLMASLILVGCKFEQKYQIYDSETNEFYVFGFPVSKGAGYVINEFLDDTNWKIETISTNIDTDYHIYNYVAFNLDNPTREDCKKLVGSPNVSSIRVFIGWYQSGQISNISINTISLNEDSIYLIKRHIYDSVFPDKRISNSHRGYFSFFGIKNVKVYCTPSFDDYSFDEVTNEKYEIDIKDIENKLIKLKEENAKADSITEAEADSIFWEISKEIVK